MGTIGIVANPNSGKDIRRLVSHATVIDNSEKVNILRRILAAIAGVGTHGVWLMPDRAGLGRRALEGMDTVPLAGVEILPMPVLDRQGDTTHFVEKMAGEKGADVLIVLGGDGTCRAAAKAIGTLPMIALSTGTNNVFPTVEEGTGAGLAAAAIAGGFVHRAELPPPAKRVEVEIAGRYTDIALVDVVVSRLFHEGARAILQCGDINRVLATRCHPGNIGFSALCGSVQIVRPGHAHGLMLRPDWAGKTHVAAFAPGQLLRFGVAECHTVPPDAPLAFTPGFDGTLALDGERECAFRAGEEIRLTITRRGPRVVDVCTLLEQAAQKGFFGPFD